LKGEEEGEDGEGEGVEGEGGKRKSDRWNCFFFFFFSSPPDQPSFHIEKEKKKKKKKTNEKLGTRNKNGLAPTRFLGSEDTDS